MSFTYVLNVDVTRCFADVPQAPEEVNVTVYSKSDWDWDYFGDVYLTEEDKRLIDDQVRRSVER